MSGTSSSSSTMQTGLVRPFSQVPGPTGTEAISLIVALVTDSATGLTRFAPVTPAQLAAALGETGALATLDANGGLQLGGSTVISFANGLLSIAGAAGMKISIPLPTSNPNQTGVLWNNGGSVCES